MEYWWRVMSVMHELWQPFPSRRGDKNGRVTKKMLFKTVQQYESCAPPFRPTPHARVGKLMHPHYIV